MLRPASRLDVLSIMEQERAEFVVLLRSLSPEDAETPAWGEGWTVKDIAVHLLGDDLSTLARCRDSYGGLDLGPLERWDDLVSALNDLNERWVEAGRFLSTRLIAELLSFTGELVSEFLSKVDPGAPGEVVSWAGPDPAPWWLVSAREFSERWVHHQQVRDALGRPGLNGPSFVGPILATVMHALPPAYQELEAPEETTVAVDVTGRAGFSWAVGRDSDGWKLYEGLSRDAATRLTLDQDTAWRFLMRMIPEKEARAKVTIEGDATYAQPFFNAVSAIVART
ncbi:MAG: maleylpyruvate isomerase family mycothiol-dependent enzyme [Actinomycetota bacterium]